MSRKDNQAVTVLNLWLWLTAVSVRDTIRVAAHGLNAKRNGPPVAGRSMISCDAGQPRSSMPAIALMRLRTYTGRPALSELPVLNELWPSSTCDGTMFRSTGTS
jgi:hypothetical protein